MIKIAPNNVVTFILGKVEMGQGTWTGLAMVMGDELDVEWKNIRAVVNISESTTWGVKL